MHVFVKMLNSLEVELQTVLSCHVGTVLYEAASACMVSYLHFLFLGELSMVENVTVP